MSIIYIIYTRTHTNSNHIFNNYSNPKTTFRLNNTPTYNNNICINILSGQFPVPLSNMII